MPKLLVNGINFHYWQVGNGPDVVMVHGLGGNLAVWHLTIVTELQPTYRITTYDLRGHGRSDVPREGYTMRDMADDLRGIMDTLGIERAHLVGHSWGADIVLQFALTFPHKVAKVILIEGSLITALAQVYRREEWEGWAYTAKTLEELVGIQVPAERRNDLEYLLKQLIEVPIVYGPARGQRRNEENIWRVLDILNTLLNAENAGGDLTVENLAKIPHPTLLIYEANSLALPAFEVLRHRLPDCTSVLLPHGQLKHLTTLEQPELTVEHIKAFLESDRIQASSVPGDRQEWPPAT